MWRLIFFILMKPYPCRPEAGGSPVRSESANGKAKICISVEDADQNAIRPEEQRGNIELDRFRNLVIIPNLATKDRSSRFLCLSDVMNEQ